MNCLSQYVNKPWIPLISLSNLRSLFRAEGFVPLEQDGPWEDSSRGPWGLLRVDQQVPR
jgi:hypothetical protein